MSTLQLAGKTLIAWSRYPLAALGLLLAAALTVLFTNALPYLVFGMIGLTFLATAVWRRPMAGVLALVLLLPFHQILVMLALRSGFPDSQLPILQGWKDVIVSILLVKVLIAPGPEKKLQLLDLLVVFFLMLGLFYLAFPNSLSVVERLYALRSDTVFLFAYFVGRFLPLTQRHLKMIAVVMIAVAVVTAAVGIFESRFPEQFQAALDTMGYQELLAVQPSLEGSTAREIGAVQVARARSTFLGYLAFAFALVPAFCVTASLATHYPTWGRRALLTLSLGLMGVALLLSGTRSGLLAAMLAVLVVIFKSRHWRYWLAVGAITLPIMAAVGYYYLEMGELLRDTLTMSDSSSVGHLDAMQTSFAVISDNPLGLGLGTAGDMARRVESEEGIVNESWYLQIGTEMGLAGMTLFLMIAAALVFYLWTVTRRLDDPFLRHLSIGMFAGALAMTFMGLLLHVWEHPTSSIVFWLLAGAVLQGRPIETRARSADQAVIA